MAPIKNDEFTKKRWTAAAVKKDAKTGREKERSKRKRRRRRRRRRRTYTDSVATLVKVSD